MITMRHQPRPQGAFPWLWGRGPAPKAREKRPGDEVGVSWLSLHIIKLGLF